jgi:hypothetical protein
LFGVRTGGWGIGACGNAGEGTSNAIAKNAIAEAIFPIRPAATLRYPRFFQLFTASPIFCVLLNISAQRYKQMTKEVFFGHKLEISFDFRIRLYGETDKLGEQKAI